jgi:exopolysaccharide biosynthesis WecB/TagA/CpsF family protein
MVQTATDVGNGQDRVEFLGLPFDRVDQDTALDLLTARDASSPFGYIATPNVYHVVIADRTPALVPVISDAWLSLCDSQPVRKLGLRSGYDLPLVRGSDLTVAMFESVVMPGDRIAVICASEDLAEALKTRRPEIDWDIMIPPPGTEPGTPAYEDCVRFIADNNARFIFVCLGAPKSERMCHDANARHDVTGTALCTGASLEFMLGMKARAPKILQSLGLEWLHRMVTEPRRLARRYLSSFIPLLRIWLRERRQMTGS